MTGSILGHRNISYPHCDLLLSPLVPPSKILELNALAAVE
jgi:hypothetical protein